MRLKIIVTVLVSFVTTLAVGQSTQELAKAIARTEGFYVKGTVPNRTNNPGDIRSRSTHAYPGQVGLNEQGYVVFGTAKAGWAALNHQLSMVAAGRSKYYQTSMTIQQFSRRYATSPLWAKNVARMLNVTPETTLAELL